MLSLYAPHGAPTSIKWTAELFKKPCKCGQNAYEKILLKIHVSCEEELFIENDETVAVGETKVIPFNENFYPSTITSGVFSFTVVSRTRSCALLEKQGRE